MQLHCWWVLVVLGFGKGEHVAVAFGTTGLNFLFSVTVLLFSVALPFLTLGFVSGRGSLY